MNAKRILLCVLILCLCSLSAFAQVYSPGEHTFQFIVPDSWNIDSSSFADEYEGINPANDSLLLGVFTSEYSYMELCVAGYQDMVGHMDYWLLDEDKLYEEIEYWMQVFLLYGAECESIFICYIPYTDEISIPFVVYQLRDDNGFSYYYGNTIADGWEICVYCCDGNGRNDLSSDNLNDLYTMLGGFMPLP